MATRKPSISEVKKPQKITGSSVTKNYNCEVCESVVKAEDKGIECEICKGWFHTVCVDLTDKEYEMLASHKLGTIHWYCTTCNIKSVELLRLVFGLQDRIQKTESEIENMKKETNEKIDHVIKKQGEYESVLVKAEARHEVLENKVSAIVKKVNALKTELEAMVKKEIEEVKTVSLAEIMTVSYTHLTLPTILRV